MNHSLSRTPPAASGAEYSADVRAKPLVLVNLWMFPAMLFAYSLIMVVFFRQYKRRRDDLDAGPNGNVPSRAVGMASPRERAVRTFENSADESSASSDDSGDMLSPSNPADELTPRRKSMLSFRSPSADDSDTPRTKKLKLNLNAPQHSEWGEADAQEVQHEIEQLESDIEQISSAGCRTKLKVVVKRQLLAFTYTIREFGTEAGIYLCCLQLIARFLFVASCAYIPVVMAYYYRGLRQGDMDLGNFTAANLLPGSTNMWLVVLASTTLHLSTQLFTAYQWTRLQRLKNMCEDNESDSLRAHTLMVRNAPLSICDEDELFWMMQQLLPNQITGAHLALDLHDIVHNKREIERVSHEQQRSATNRCAGKKLAQLTRELEALREEEVRLDRAPKVSTGIGFLTFRTTQQARKFMRRQRDGDMDFRKEALQMRQDAQMRQSPLCDEEMPEIEVDEGVVIFEPEVLKMSTWRVSIAPAPKDILWENLRIDSITRQRKKLCVEISMGSLLILGTLCCMVGVVCIGFHYVDVMYDIQAKVQVVAFLDMLFDRLGYWFFLVALLPPLCFVGIIAAIPSLAQMLIRIEAQLTRSKVLESYVAKVFAFFLLSNLIVTSLGWVVIARFTDTNDSVRVFVDVSGTFHISLIFMECFMFIPFRMFRGWNLRKGHYWKKPTWHSLPSPAMPFNPTMSIDQVDEAEELMFDFSRQYGEVFSILAMVLAYSPIIPFLLPVGWLYFFIIHKMDVKILRDQFAKHKAEDRRVRTVNNHMLICVLVSQVIPLPFVIVRGSRNQAFVMLLFFVWTLFAYLVYADRSMTDGKYLYRKVKKSKKAVVKKSRRAAKTKKSSKRNSKSPINEDGDSEEATDDRAEPPSPSHNNSLYRNPLLDPAPPSPDPENSPLRLSVHRPTPLRVPIRVSELSMDSPGGTSHAADGFGVVSDDMTPRDDSVW